MAQECENARDFLDSVLRTSGLRLNVSLSEATDQCLLNIEGPDEELLLVEAGDLLEALQHLVNQAFGRSLPQGQRIVCDVHSFRATREAELRAMAQHAAQQVRSSGVPFTFSAMNANERRIIHLTLADSEDLETASVGEGPDRKLKISLRNTPK